MKKVKKAVILCGGLATRFLPISKSVPKEMLPLLDKPILQVIVEDLVKAGIEDIFILVGRGKECILNHFDKNVELEERLKETNKIEELKVVQRTNNFANIVFKRQLEPRGTGYGVEIAKSFVGDDPFVLMYGDEVMFCEGKNNVEQLIETYNREGKSVISVQTVPHKDVCKYGSIVPGKAIENGYYVNSVIEKPPIDKAPSDICYIGACVLTSDIFPALDKIKVEKGKEKILTDALDYLCKEGKCCARIIDGERHDMGNKFGFVRANIYACLRDEEFSGDMKKLILDLAKELKD